MVCWVCGGVWATGSGEELESQERAETRALTQCSLDIYSQYCPHHHPPSLDTWPQTNNKHSLRHGVNGPSAN